ncbi:serine hydrolase [Paucilactobacillus nenjiangensis]|jgi:D-alanyl-D-alanine carboxypeptidase (penicillin-binding protein 5/6)|uniref:D-alanyl-D-alanine carboxypeptidase n=1 Tax=Paucilactobacillus nenjiangensis TaxID=1296540 RepID=A0A5P1X672_9LACO|nr:serine hydrolase [Paucilactobacillus nenjiangensis]QER68159.1 D-alanyl-D-alanine carboxypeptidase [Paucilactobacillus nenjiangensis]
MKKWLISILSALLIFSSGFGTIIAQADDTQPEINASAALAIDATTGQILYEKNAKQVLPIASISKILAVSVILDEIQAGKISWDTKVTISPEIAAVSADTALSNIVLNQGQQYTVKQLVHAALIKSADGATLALSTMNGDTVTSFNKKMQAKAKAIGVDDAKIYNAVGLQNSDLDTLKVPGMADSVENEMSATDVAKISQYVIKHYPAVLKITATKSEMFDTTTMDNLNEMLPGNASAMTNYTTDGLKTGTSDAAGQSFVGTGTYKGHRIITVILHANDTSRYTQTANLVNYVIGKYIPTTVDSSTSFAKATTVTVPNGKTVKLKTQFTGKMTLWLSTGTSVQNLSHKFLYKSALKDKNGKLTAPIKKNQTVGQVSLSGDNMTFIDGTGAKISLKAKAADAQANIFVRGWRAVFGY